MIIKDYKCKCGHNDFFFVDKGNQKGIYCTYCGKWFKWADKDEQNLAILGMREETPEEQKAISDYLKRISKPTGENFWDLVKCIPANNAIDRQAVLNTLDDMDKALDIDRTVENYKVLLRECFENLTTVQPVNEWIPVSDLPKEADNYLTSIRHYGKERYVQVSFFDGMSFKAEVEAWMPLPKPYKENEDRTR